MEGPGRIIETRICHHQCKSHPLTPRSSAYLAPHSDDEPINSGYSANGFGSIAQIPQLVIPRSDDILLEVALGTLSKAGWPTEVLTGRLMFHLGDNERHTQKSVDDE
nr:hypothetical protein CFP56_11588 [Quercus suber]